MSSIAGENTNSWAFHDHADDQISMLLGVVPSRWGRMTPLCRLLIVETARLLQCDGIIQPGERLITSGLSVGLVGGTRRGSLMTDQGYIATMTAGPGFASPALFGYTLPTIPLAETASVFGLVGPVYALIEETNPLKSAEDEALRLLLADKNLDFMLACEFDHYGQDGADYISVTLTRKSHDADSNTGIPKVE